MILEPKKINFVTVSIVPPSICHEVMQVDAVIIVVCHDLSSTESMMDTTSDILLLQRKTLGSSLAPHCPYIMKSENQSEEFVSCWVYLEIGRAHV